MGRVVVVNFVSIDGVVQAPLSADEDRDGGFQHGGWVPPYSDDAVDEFMQDSTVGAAGMLLGRRSFEILADAWADADQSVPAIAAMNRMPKYVVSTTPPDLSRWENSHSVGGSLPGAVSGLKAQTDGELVVFGAATLIRGLAQHDLIDEYRLVFFPVILGQGKRMFDEHGDFARFRLTNSATTSTGVVLLNYERAA